MKLKLTVNRWYQLDSGRFVERREGDLIEVSEKVGSWLLKNGSAISADGAAVVEAVETNMSQPEPDAQDTPEEEASSSSGKPERPANAANRDAWDAYARQVGVDPTQHKSKEELRAALP